MAFNPLGLNDPYADLRDGTPPNQVNNGQQGANKSLANAAVQSGAPKPSGNPFEAMLSHVSAFNGGGPRQAVNTQYAAGAPEKPWWEGANGVVAAPTYELAGENHTADRGDGWGGGGGTSSAPAVTPTWGVPTQTASVENRVDDPGGAWSGGGNGAGANVQPQPNNPPPADTTGGRNRGAGQNPSYQKPADTEDPTVAAEWYRQWLPDITPWDVTNFRNWATANGKGEYPIEKWYAIAKGDPSVKPEGTEDPVIAALWYGRTIPGITAAEVTAFRNWAISTGNLDYPIAQWYANGKPQQQAAPTSGQTPLSSGEPQYNPNIPADGQYDYITGKWVNPRDPNAVWNPNTRSWDRPQPAAPAGPTPPGVPGPNGGPDWMTPEPAAPLTSDGKEISHKPIDEYASPYNIQNSGLEDALNRLLGKQFGREQDQLGRQLRANAALTGQIDSGGFGETYGSAMSDLVGKQGSRSADYLFTADQAEKNRQSQAAIAKMMDDLERFKVGSNADLERYLQANALELQKYGIDKNDILDRYKTLMQLEGVKYSADAGVSAAGLQAAASAAAASAGAGASMHNSNNSYNLGLAGIDADRERNYMNFFATVLGLGPEYAKLIFGSSPESLINGLPFPSGNTYVQP
jgi:hypothetical protein